MWLVEYYSRDGRLLRKYVEAKDKKSALNVLKQTADLIIEILCCIKVADGREEVKNGKAAQV